MVGGVIESLSLAQTVGGGLIESLSLAQTVVAGALLVSQLEDGPQLVQS